MEMSHLVLIGIGIIVCIVLAEARAEKKKKEQAKELLEQKRLQDDQKREEERKSREEQRRKMEKQAIPQPVAHATPKTAVNVTSRPASQVVPKPAAQVIPKPAAQIIPKPAAQVIPKPTAQTKHKTEDIVRIPDKKDGAALAYRYSVPFVPSDLDSVLSAAKAERWYLSAKQVGKEIHLFSEETDLGVLTERAEMVSDWLRRRDPYLAILERVNSETGCTVMLVFYRDKQKYNAHREQTIVALTGYKSDEKQYTISILEAGEELEAEEDYEKEDRVFVSCMGDIIGSLPKKYAVRFINEGAALIVFDHYDKDEDTFICKPFVKIYW